MINRDQKIIITGGPGAGKSTIIEKLSAKNTRAYWSLAEPSFRIKFVLVEMHCHGLIGKHLLK